MPPPPGADTLIPQTRYTPPGPGTHSPGANTPPGADPSGTRYTPPGAEHAGRYGQRAGGTHPTGMQSCSKEKIGLNFVTCERSLSGIIVTFSALITTNKMVTVSNSILPSTQSEMSLKTGSTVLCVLYNYELLWCIHTGQNQDRNRDQEQMGCMKLCVNFHITPEPG